MYTNPKGSHCSDVPGIYRFQSAASANRREKPVPTVCAPTANRPPVPTNRHKVGTRLLGSHTSAVALESGEAMYEHLIEQTTARLVGWILKDGAIEYTGRSRNATQLVKPMDVFKAYYKQDRSYFQETYNYKPKGQSDAPGAKAPIWKDHIRKDVLPLALARVLEAKGITPAELPPMIKKEVRNDKEHSEKALPGWEWKNKTKRPWTEAPSEPQNISDDSNLDDAESCAEYWDDYMQYHMERMNQEQDVEPPVEKERPARHGKRKRGSGPCKCGACGGEKPQRATACARPCPGGAM